MRFSPLILAVALAGCAGSVHPQDKRVADPPLHTDMYGALAQPDGAHTLVIVVHDDGDPGIRSDESAFAKAAASAVPESVTVTVLRPGHHNASGNSSAGNRGAGKGDDFTLDRLVRLGKSVETLKRMTPNARVILVGDGGGAALVADLAGLQPEIADGILLVGCPCALPEWRSHMAKRTGDSGWASVVSSLDPLKFAGGVSTAMRVVVLVGADDAVTPVSLSRTYVEALTLRGIGTDYRIVPARGHNLLGDAETLSALTRLAANLPEKP